LRMRAVYAAGAALPVLFLAGLSGCSSPQDVRAGDKPAQEGAVTVGVTPITRQPISRQLTLSSELVPFQEIDVFAKESGYVKQLYVDYGTRVKAGQLMAVLEIPELEVQIKQDQAAVQSAADQVMHAHIEIKRLEEEQKVYHLEFTRLKAVSDKQPGLVAQQELDDKEGRDLAAQSRIEEAKATMQVAQGQLDAAKATTRYFWITPASRLHSKEW
jgi:multidrug efflux pump subunit AcrA (membrane-fusion protein)